MRSRIGLEAGTLSSVDRQTKIQASFEKGVLTIKLPKGPEAQKPEKKIPISST